MNRKMMLRHLWVLLALLSMVLAACSSESVPEAPEALGPDLQTEAVTSRTEMMRRAEEWIDKVDFRDPYRLAQPWRYRQDCSGYISYVWGLGKPGDSSTQPYTGLFAPGKGYGYAIKQSELQFGDVLNKPRTGPSYDGHIVMFGGWVDKSKGTFWRYHVTGPRGVRGPNYGARKSIKNISDYSSAKGYTPVRSNALKGQPQAQLIESISVGNKYWNYVGNTLKSSGYLSSVDRYKASTGPCYGKGSSCEFDTRTFVTLNGKLLESISVGNRYWNFDGNTLYSRGYLSSVDRYKTGPCYGKGSACKFDSRTFVTLNGKLLESISVGNRYWNFDGNTLYSKGYLSSVSRYKASTGPCYGKGSACKFDSRTFVTLNGKLLESISVGNRYWNFDGHTLYSRGYLSSVDRYKTGPCYGKGSACTFDSRTFVTLP